MFTESLLHVFVWPSENRKSGLVADQKKNKRRKAPGALDPPLTFKTERRVSSDSCPYDQCPVLKYLHRSSLLLIAQSVDIHPNRGPSVEALQQS